MRLSVRWKKDRKLQFRLALFTGGRSLSLIFTTSRLRITGKISASFSRFIGRRYTAITVRSQYLTCVITTKVAPHWGKAWIRSKLQRFVVFVSKQTRNLISPFDKPIAHRYYAPRSHDSSVVQSVERRTVNPYVTGSSPVRGAKFLFSGVLRSTYMIRFQ